MDSPSSSSRQPLEDLQQKDYEYPDPEIAHASLWPMNTTLFDAAHNGELGADLQEISDLLREGYPSEEEHEDLNPGNHFATLDRYGAPLDSDYLNDDETEQSNDQLSDLDHLDSLQATPGGGGRGGKRSRGRGRERGGRGRGQSQNDSPSNSLFCARRRGRSSSRASIDNPRGRGVKRGYRNPLKPSDEFTSLHSQANFAYIEKDYDKAEHLINQAIALNPEIFESHSLLSEIHLAQGDTTRSVLALFLGAHTRPSEGGNWARAAEQIEWIAKRKLFQDQENDGSTGGYDDEDDEDAQGDDDGGNQLDVNNGQESAVDDDPLQGEEGDEQGDEEEPLIGGTEAEDRTARDLLKKVANKGRPSDILRTAVYCYQRLLTQDRDNKAARLKRAALSRKVKMFKTALRDYEFVRKEDPANTEVLRNIAEIQSLRENGSAALECFDTTIKVIEDTTPNELASFGWPDIHIWAQIFIHLQRFQEASAAIKKMARWMLGRGSDVFWDSYTQDDREFDVGHEPRRSEVLPLEQRHPLLSYGEGLPLELRIQMGICRLKQGPDHFDEAMMHFEYLDPDIHEESERLVALEDLLQEVGDALRAEHRFHEALRFYEPVKYSAEELNEEYVKALAHCYRELGMIDDVEECWRILAQTKRGQSDIAGRKEMIRLLVTAGQDSRAAPYRAELAWKRRRRFRLPPRIGKEGGNKSLEDPDQLMETIEGDDEVCVSEASFRKPEPSRKPRRKGVMPPVEEQEDLQPMFQSMRDTKVRLDNGDKDAREEWMKKAGFLLSVFGEATVFFPYDKNVKFLGYSAEDRARSLASKKRQLEMDMERAMQLRVSLDQLPPWPSPPAVYCQVNFEDWLDVFLEFAILLAEDDNQRGSYNTLDIVTAANVWFHSKKTMSLVNIVWAICALVLRDQKRLSVIGRYFMAEQQFVPDSYRLQSALHRICHRPNACFNESATLKFVLRQIKAMDFCVIPEAKRREMKLVLTESVGLTSKDEAGKEIQATGFNVPLLMLYGQMLMAGGSTTEALNYYYRAHALQPEHPLVNLSLALAYVHWALKRQSPNRHTHIMQGLSFLFKYRELRMGGPGPLVEKQEAEFNVARTFHMLGLNHLAIPRYRTVLEMGEEMQREWRGRDGGAANGKGEQSWGDVQMTDDGHVAAAAAAAAAAEGSGPGEEPQRRAGGTQEFREDFTIDAAYALQDLYATAGNMDGAYAIVEKYMVL